MSAKEKRSANKAVMTIQVVSPEEKIARLLGVLVVKDIEQQVEQVTLLRSVGFQVPEVAAILRITENHVHVAAYKGRKMKVRGKGEGASEKMR